MARCLFPLVVSMLCGGCCDSARAVLVQSSAVDVSP
jgi:hypothetical protein